MAFGSFTFAAPAAQKAASGGGAAPPQADVGAQYLTAGMKSVADSIAQAIQYNRIMQGYGAVGGELSAGLGGGGASGAAGAGTSSAGGGARLATGDGKGVAGTNYTLDDLHQMAAAEAQKNKIDPTAALKMFNTEFGSGAKYAGDSGSSFGPYQAHIGGINPNMPHAGMGDEMLAAGIDPRDPNTMPQQIAFAMKYAATHGWQPWATSRDKLGFDNWTGISRQTADMPAPGAQPAAGTGLPPGAPNFGPSPGQAAVAGALGQGTPMGAFPPGFGQAAGMGAPVGTPSAGPYGAVAGASPPQGPQMGAGPPPAPGGPIPPNMTATAPQPAPRPALPPPPPPQQPPLVGGPMLAQGVGGQAGNFPSPGQGMVSAAMQPPPRQPLPLPSLAGAATAPPPGAPAATTAPGQAQGGAAPPVGAGGAAPPTAGAQPAEGRAASASPDVQAQIQHLLNVINYPDPYGKLTEQKAVAKEQLERLLNPQLQVVEIGIDKDSGKPIRAEFDPRTGKLTPINAPGSTSSAAAPGSTPAAAQPAAAPAMPKGYDGVFSPDDWNGVLATPKIPQPQNMIGADFSKWQLDKQAEAGKGLSTESNPIIKTYQESARSLNAANKLSTQDTSAADKGLAESYQRVFNPSGVVRPTQMVMIEGAQGILDEVAGKLKGWVDGESRLSPDLRARMMAAMQAQVESDRHVAGTEILSRAGDIVRYGGNPASFMPKLEQIAPFNPADINKYNPTAHGVVPGSGPGPQPQQAPQPPPGAPPGTKQAPDGKFYAPDPARPGKYLLVH